jgi:hypothetical protein
VGERLYLDNCCFNRPYDDQAYLTIKLESEAKLFVQKEILRGTFALELLPDNRQRRSK